MQETWAIHGVYPAHGLDAATTRALVFWAGGKIRRVDVARRQRPRVDPVPRAAPTHRVARGACASRARRSRRAGRCACCAGSQVSPARRQGRLPGARPPLDPRPARRHAAAPHPQDDHFELYPSWSRDGRQSSTSRWDDAALGSVRVVRRRRRRARAWSPSKPGHYVEPALIARRRAVVYRTVRRRLRHGPLWSTEPGIYAVPAAGGAPTLVTRNGRAAALRRRQRPRLPPASPRTRTSARWSASTSTAATSARTY